jgi:hypothetical protein
MGYGSAGDATSKRRNGLIRKRFSPKEHEKAAWRRISEEENL